MCYLEDFTFIAICDVLILHTDYLFIGEESAIFFRKYFSGSVPTG